MAKQYQVIWKSANLNDGTETYDSVLVNDIVFKDQYVQIDLHDSDYKVLYIPYYRIIEITRTGQDDETDMYHP